MEPRTAFARAEGFLDYSRGWIWTARSAAVLAALGTLGLLVVLTLFVDLVIHRGRPPEYSTLRPAAQAEYARRWQTLDRDARLEALDAVGISGLDRSKWFDDAGMPLGPPGNEWAFRAWVGKWLQTAVRADAAEQYRLAVFGPEQSSPPSLGIVSLGLRQPGMIQSVVGAVASMNPWSWKPSGRSGANTGYLIGLAALGILFATFRAVMLNLMNYAASTASLDAATRMRRAIYHQSYRLGTLSLRDAAADETVEMFASNIETVYGGLYARLTHLFFLPVSIGVLVAFALAVDFWLAIAWFLFGAAVVLVGGYYAARFRDRAEYHRKKAAGHLQMLRESLASMRLVKSNLMELFNQSRVERQLADYSAASFARFRNESLFAPLLVFLGTVAFVFAMAIGGYAALHGSTGPVKIIVLACVLGAILWAVNNLFERRRTLRKARTAAVPVFEFLDRPGEVGQVVGAEFLSGVDKGIEFRNVSLREPGSGRLLLDDLNLKVKAGQRIAVVGTDEAEKHALVYLLLRYLDANTGDIRIDDKSVKWLTLESLRAQIGLVLWDSLVFNDTVANNIGCGDPSVTLPQIIECAKLAHVHQFVQKLPHGYETPIGEFGVRLRRSERFRIALARAILKEPSIYVIEEPSRAFEDADKGMIDDTLTRILPGKTVIFLAHRISTIRSCDLVYLIHNGRVQASGEHRELIAKSDLYKHLHYMEFNEFARA